MKNKNGLSKKRQRFCDEYLVDLNGTQAAIRAGYSAKTAKQIGSKLLTMIDVAQYIAKQQKIIQNSKIADATEVEEYLTSAMRDELSEEVVAFGPDGQPVKVSKGLAGREKIKAAELMARRHGLLTDNVNANVTGTVVIEGFNDDDSSGSNTSENA